MPSGANRPQTCLFSATVPPWVRTLAKNYLVNPHDVDLVGNSKLKVALGVKHVSVAATNRQMGTMLADLITLYRTQHAIVFVNTKRDADDLVAELGLIIKGALLPAHARTNTPFVQHGPRARRPAQAPCASCPLLLVPCLCAPLLFSFSLWTLPRHRGPPRGYPSERPREDPRRLPHGPHPGSHRNRRRCPR